MRMLRISRPSCGTPRHNDDRTPRNAGNVPSRAPRIPSHTNHKCQRTERRVVWRMDCCVRSHRCRVALWRRILYNTPGSHWNWPFLSCARSTGRIQSRIRCTQQCNPGPSDRDVRSWRFSSLQYRESVRYRPSRVLPHRTACLRGLRWRRDPECRRQSRGAQSTMRAIFDGQWMRRPTVACGERANA